MGRIVISMVPMNQRNISQQDFMAKLGKELRQFKNMRISMFDFATRGMTARGSFPMEFYIQGQDWKKLQEISLKAMADMEKTGVMTGIDMDYQEGMPEIQIFPDREKAALQGVPVQSILQTVKTAMGGAREGRFTNEGRRYDIRLRLIDSQRGKVDDILKLDVHNDYSEVTPIRSVIKLKQTEAIINKHLMPRYSVKTRGSSQSFVEAFASLYFALILGLVVAYIALAIQFNSSIHPLIILLAVPQAFNIGAGSEARMPMALTIIGGIFFSMSFSLVVVPAAYYIMAKFEKKKNPELDILQVKEK